MRQFMALALLMVGVCCTSGCWRKKRVTTCEETPQQVEVLEEVTTHFDDRDEADVQRKSGPMQDPSWIEEK